MLVLTLPSNEDNADTKERWSVFWTVVCLLDFNIFSKLLVIIYRYFKVVRSVCQLINVINKQSYGTKDHILLISTNWLNNFSDILDQRCSQE